MHVLPDAGHQMFQDNPRDFVNVVIADLMNLTLHTLQVRAPSVRYQNENGQFVDYITGEVTEEAQIAPPNMLFSVAGVSPNQAP
jgi:hypothetical protein